MRIVRKAILLFFRIMQKQPKLHALTRQLSIGERSQTSEDCFETRVSFSHRYGLAGVTVLTPLTRHPDQIVNE